MYTNKQIVDNCFKGVILKQPSCYHDFRGYYWTVHKEANKFNHDKVSVSHQNVLRGIHGDFNTTKYVTCVYGEVYCVIVDNRKNSSTFNKWRWLLLSHHNKNNITLPPGVGLSYLVISNEASILYKLSYKEEYSDINNQFTIPWNSKKLNIYWPTKTPIIQERDI
tara:strand:+ start:169 stop:663 length:495 start_codon:yes stop_codon:yes gene_type:complete